MKIMLLYFRIQKLLNESTLMLEMRLLQNWISQSRISRRHWISGIGV